MRAQHPGIRSLCVCFGLTCELLLCSVCMVSHAWRRERVLSEPVRLIVEGAPPPPTPRLVHHPLPPLSPRRRV